jgi:alkylated DNA repair dioxygenase AlkB
MTPPIQGDFFSLGPEAPEGLRYRDGFLSPEEQASLIEDLGALTYRPFEFRGVLARRHVAYFGYGYDFDVGRLAAAEPIPTCLLPLRDRAAAFADLLPVDLPHVLVNKYEPGAPIGWHRDRPQFADVVGVSLGAPGRFRMRRRTAEGWKRFALTVASGSIYLLRGSARWDWEHSLPPGAGLRYSVTFRSLRETSQNLRP